MSQAAEQTLTKGEFAAHLGVSAGRVSQYISEGKIGPDALDGTGRGARVFVRRAMEQVRGRRDMSQALGNGLSTRLDFDAAPVPRDAPAPSPSVPRPDSVDEQFKREKLRGVQIANRKAAEEEEARAGRFVEAAETRLEMSRLASGLLQAFEGSLPALATAVAAKFEVSQRDVLHLLRTEFRAIRLAQSTKHRATAAEMSPTIDSIVEGEIEDPE